MIYNTGPAKPGERVGGGQYFSIFHGAPLWNLLIQISTFCLRLSVFIVCSEIPFSKYVCHTETYQLIWSVNQLTGFGFCIILVFNGKYFRTDIKFSSFFWGWNVLNLLIFWIGKLSYVESIRMSSGVIEIIKRLHNITESCASPVQYAPLK